MTDQAWNNPPEDDEHHSVKVPDEECVSCKIANIAAEQDATLDTRKP